MTSPSPLDRLAGPGNVLAKEPPDAKEFAGLVRSGLARLKDAENEANSLDSRFDLAYGHPERLSRRDGRHREIPARRVAKHEGARVEAGRNGADDGQRHDQR